MKKSTRLLRKLVAPVLVLLLSIESFGAIVGDNDGSAFITKAEFDSLKNDFQSQIDQYNISIDSKIDGALASYLAGVAKKTETIECNIIALEWSIMVIDKLKVIENVTKGTTTSPDQETLWNMSYFMVGVGSRGSLWHTKDFAYGAKSPYINLIHLANSLGSISTGTYATTQNKYSYLDHLGDAVWEGISGIGKFTGETMWSKEYTYSNASLDRVYNYSDSTKTTYFAPVTYDNDLYFTNKKANRQYIPPSNRINWEGRSVRNNNLFGILGVITAGENLETEAENSSGTRNWYNKSLISQSRLIYDFKDENGKTYTDHRMTNGIPIYAVISNSDVTNVKITLNIK